MRVVPGKGVQLDVLTANAVGNEVTNGEKMMTQAPYTTYTELFLSLETFSRKLVDS